MIINPDTKAPISPTTMRQHFRAELDRGHILANSKVVGAMFKNATTGTKAFPGGIPVSQIFWLKARAHWRTVDKPGGDTPPTPPSATHTALEIARRIAYLLHVAGNRGPVTITQKKG